MDIPADTTAATGIVLDLPASPPIGPWDIRIDWTWKDPPRRLEGCTGQYFVDEPQKGPGNGAQDLPRLDLWELYKTGGLPVTIVLGVFGLIGYGITWLLRKNLASWRRFLNQVWDGFPQWFKRLLTKLPF